VSAVGGLGSLSSAQLVGLIGGVGVLGLLAAAQAAQGLFLTHLLRQSGRLLVRIEALEGGLATYDAVPAPSENEAQADAGLPLGSQAPGFGLSGLYGETLTLDSLRARGKPVMLIFTHPDWATCTALLPEIGLWQQEHAAKLTVSLVSRGTVEENRAKSTEQGLSGVLMQKDWEVSEAYGVESTPSAVLVRSDGTIGSPVLEGADAISALLAYAVGERSRLPLLYGGQQGELHPASEDAAAQTASRASGFGEPAPQIELPDLNGATVSLTYVMGEKVVVLFWDPECGFCREMLPQLKAWEDKPPGEAPKLLVVSTGGEEANREMGLSSPVLLDEQLTVGRAFGAPGTPSAVLIDEQGQIASELAVGPPRVLALIRAPQVAGRRITSGASEEE
jgi:peroxiredoxin